MLNSGILQISDSGYSLCNGNLRKINNKILRYTLDPSHKEKKIKRIYEKFGSNEKVLKVKLKEIMDLPSKLMIQFLNFDRIRELRIPEKQGTRIEHKVSGSWSLENFSDEGELILNIKFI